MRLNFPLGFKKQLAAHAIRAVVYPHDGIAPKSRTVEHDFEEALALAGNTMGAKSKPAASCALCCPGCSNDQIMATAQPAASPRWLVALLSRSVPRSFAMALSASVAG